MTPETHIGEYLRFIAQDDYEREAGRPATFDPEPTEVHIMPLIRFTSTGYPIDGQLRAALVEISGLSAPDIIERCYSVLATGKENHVKCPDMNVGLQFSRGFAPYDQPTDMIRYYLEVSVWAPDVPEPWERILAALDKHAFKKHAAYIRARIAFEEAGKEVTVQNQDDATYAAKSYAIEFQL